jgi:carbonic anhydrase
MSSDNTPRGTSTFACAINCMDGRVQDAVKNYMQENYGVDYVDMVTEPGPNKILADASTSSAQANLIIENIKKRVEVSTHHHGSKVIAIVGHFGCAGNPTEKEEQIEHLKKAEKVVKDFGFDAEIILLWVDGDWTTVEKI